MITMSYPARNPVDSITLRNPVLGNSDQFDIKTRFRKSMDNILRSYKSTPELHTLLMTFVDLDKAKIDELLTFFSNSGGNEIKLVDHRGITWRGFIINQPFEALSIGPADEPSAGSLNRMEVSTVTIEFRCRPAVERMQQSIIFSETMVGDKV